MASIQTPVRQPFGVLDGTKLRNLQSLKNRQNAIAPSSAPSLKRRHATTELSDSENVDPVESKGLAPKRKKTDIEDDLCKHSNFAARPFSKPKPRLSSSKVFTPRPETPSVKVAAESMIISSAPAAAGRSPPQAKRAGILSSRRTRLKAPVYGSRSHAPLSLAAALNGTLSSKKHQTRVDTAILEESKPKSWFFDIYEESQEQQNFTINEWSMTKSALSLDISDDESKTSAAKEERGKENIPPSELHTAASATRHTVAQPPTSRKDMMTDEPRTPLGDLNPSDYYAAGCDATSVVIVAEDTTEPAKPGADDGPVKAQPPCSDFNLHAELHGAEEQDKTMTMSKSELHALLLDVGPTMPAEQHDIEEPVVYDQANDVNDEDKENAEPADIEIWESGSAKDESGDVETAESIFADL